MIAVRRLILPASVGLAALALAGGGAGSDPSTGQHATSKQDVARTYLAAIRRGDLKAALALASAGSKDFASGFDKTLRQEVVGDHLARVTGPVVRDDAFVYELTGTTRQKNDAGAVVLIAHDQVTLQLSFERAGRACRLRLFVAAFAVGLLRQGSSASAPAAQEQFALVPAAAIELPRTIKVATKFTPLPIHPILGAFHPDGKTVRGCLGAPGYCFLDSQTARFQAACPSRHPGRHPAVTDLLD